MKYLVLGYSEALLSNTECAAGSCRENAVTSAGIACLISQMREDALEVEREPAASKRRNMLPLGCIPPLLSHPSSSGGTC